MNIPAAAARAAAVLAVCQSFGDAYGADEFDDDQAWACWAHETLSILRTTDEEAWALVVGMRRPVRPQFEDEPLDAEGQAAVNRLVESVRASGHRVIRPDIWEVDRGSSR